jgi:NAD dependent epimerase/dehydratase family enzyme
MADELLLSCAKVEPERLKESGYQFKHPDLSSALKAILGA